MSSDVPWWPLTAWSSQNVISSDTRCSLKATRVCARNVHYKYVELREVHHGYHGCTKCWGPIAIRRFADPTFTGMEQRTNSNYSVANPQPAQSTCKRFQVQNGPMELHSSAKWAYPPARGLKARFIGRRSTSGSRVMIAIGLGGT